MGDAGRGDLAAGAAAERDRDAVKGRKGERAKRRNECAGGALVPPFLRRRRACAAGRAARRADISTGRARQRRRASRRVQCKPSDASRSPGERRVALQRPAG